MGYFLTTEAETAVPAKSHASPKTHTPLPRLQERGLRFYSSGIGRWVNRDPIGETDGRNVFAFVANDPVGVLDLLGETLIVIDPDAPVLTYSTRMIDADPCGAFMWIVAWHLSKSSAKGGWVVQRVNTSAAAVDCNGNPVTLDTLHIGAYNEAVGGYVPAGRSRSNPRSTYFGDQWYWGGAPDGTKGYVEMFGTANFWDGLANPVPGYTPDPDNNNTPHGPTLPDGTGVKIGKGGWRKLTVYWNCCCGERMTQFVMEEGSFHEEGPIIE
jgi:RHS repeat-associated protein